MWRCAARLLCLRLFSLALPGPAKAVECHAAHLPPLCSLTARPQIIDSIPGDTKGKVLLYLHVARWGGGCGQG